MFSGEIWIWLDGLRSLYFIADEVLLVHLQPREAIPGIVNVGHDGAPLDLYNGCDSGFVSLSLCSCDSSSVLAG